MLLLLLLLLLLLGLIACCSASLLLPGPVTSLLLDASQADHKRRGTRRRPTPTFTRPQT